MDVDVSIESSEIGRSSDRSGHWGFWLLIALLALVAAGKVIQADTMDPDAFWHLRVAEQLRSDGIHPLIDRISFASLKTPWTPYSWLAELLMQWVWDNAGFGGAILLTAACSAAIVFLIAAGCRVHARTQNDIGAALCTAMGAFFTLPFISFRPVTFALVVLAFITLLMLIDRRRPTRWVWVCVPLSVLQTNLHLYAVIGALLASLSAIGSAIERKSDLKRKAFLAMAMALAICCTPLLPGVVSTALRYNADDPMVASNFITEMRPFYTGTTGRVSLGLVLAALILCVAKRDRLSIVDWAWLAMSLLLLFRLGRFSPVFAIIAMPIVARAFPHMRGSALRKPVVRMALILVLLAGGISVALAYPWKLNFNAWLNRNNATYPTAAADFVEANVRTANHKLINEFNWGGYLAWRLGNRYQILMDGRTQLYAPEFWKQTHLGTRSTRTELLKTVQADAAILPVSDSALAPSLVEMGWTVGYRDELAEVLLPPPPTATTSPHIER